MRKGMRKGLLWLLVLVISITMVGAFSLTSCKEEAAPTEEAAEEAPAEEGEEAAEEAPAEEGAEVVAEEAIKMIYIVKSMDNPYWDAMIKGAEEAGRDLGIEVEGLAPITAYDVEEQIRLIEEGIVKGVDAILVVPSDSNGIIPGIEKANEAGIPVVTPNSRALGGKVVSWMGYGNTEAEYEVVKYALSQLPMNDPKVIILEGKPGNQISVEIGDGMIKAIEESDKNIEILASQPANFSRVDAQTVMENLLQQFPEIDYVIGANGDTALGAIEAIDAAGRLDEIIVTGFNGTADELAAIKEGKLLATCMQRPDVQAYWGVVTAYIALKGMDCPKEFYLSSPLITADNADEYSKYTY